MNRYAALIMITGLLTTASLEAQTFQRTLGGIYDDKPHCIDTTIDGGSIISGDQSVVVPT